MEKGVKPFLHGLPKFPRGSEKGLSEKVACPFFSAYGASSSPVVNVGRALREAS